MENPTEQKQSTQKLLKRRGLPFAAVEHLIVDDPRVSRDALVIYLVLCRYADWNTSIAFPSIELIRIRLKMRKQDIIGAIKELEELNYLKVQRRPGQKSFYEVGPEVKPVTSSQAEPHQFPGGTGTSSDAEPEQETSNKRQLTREEEPAEPSSPSSKPLPSDPPGGGNGQGKLKGQRCTDPVILAYVHEHEAEYGFQPLIPFSKVGVLLKALRKTYPDEQLVKIVQAARRSRAWFRKADSFDLATILSAAAINQILRDNPYLLKTPENQKPRDPCPVCGSAEVVAGSCGTCRFDLRGDRTPESIRDWRLQAVWHGALKPRNEQERVDADAWHDSQLAQRKADLAEVAA